MSGVWTTGGSLATARYNLYGAGTQTAGLSFGGYDSAVSSVTEEYDGSAWSSGGALATARQDISGCGTQTAGLSAGGYDGTATSSVTEEYDGTSWASGGSLGTARKLFSTIGTQTSALAIAGTTDGTDTLSSSEEYDGTSWTAGGALSTARNRLAGAGTQSAGLAISGYDGTNNLSSTEEYDGTSWTAGGNIVTAVRGHAGAGSQTAGLSFGGYDTANTTTTEQYDGSAWSVGGYLNTARRGLGGAGTQSAGLSFGGWESAASTVTEEYNIISITSSDWSYRRKVTVSNTNIDSDLTHFPLLLTLSTSAGTSSTDLTSIFTEISDANKLKIAITKSDGTTQLYGEIEKWDSANKEAIIWVSSSGLTLSSSGTTDVYFYYDSSQADNSYIGIKNSIPAQSVWDSNYKMVQHLDDGADTSSTYDSTSNNNDLTKLAAGEPAVTTSGKIGNAQDFDGVDDKETHATFLDTLPAALTFEFWINFDTTFDSSSATAVIPLEKVNDLTTGSYDYLRFRWLDGDGRFYLNSLQNNTAATAYSTTSSWTGGTWYYIAGKIGSGGIEVWVNGVSEGTNANTQMPDDGTAQDFILGLENKSGAEWAFFDGKMDEVRVSDTARSSAWIKANYYSQTDGLVAWGSEEGGTEDNAILFGINF